MNMGPFSVTQPNIVHDVLVDCSNGDAYSTSYVCPSVCLSVVSVCYVYVL